MKQKLKTTKSFRFFQDVKKTTWDRHYFNVTANTKEEAIEYLKKHIDEISYDLEAEPDSPLETEGFENLGDVDEYMTVEENDGFATIEWYDDDNPRKILFANGKC